MDTTLFLPDSFDPKLVWGIFTRLLGLMFLVSFASLSTQVVPAAGREGVTPVAKWFPRMRSDFAAPQRYFYFPTLLWLSAKDAMLRGLCFAGMAAALGVVYGGPFSFACLLVCYLAYLSLDLPMGLIFPWDCVLFEASFFSLFLGPTLPLPSLEAVHPPEPAIAWMYRLLLFRVMFGFGKFKFLGATKADRGYLKGFLINQPLPSYIGWYMEKLPMWMLKGALFLMFVAEIPAPLLLFFPGRASIIGDIVIFLLMIAIQACGSFGYFSMVMMVVCVTVLDSITARQLALSTMFATPSAALASTVVLLHTIGVIINFPFNSWVSQRWFLWPHFLRARPRWLTAPLVFYRALYPFRCFHSYGVFFPGSSPGIKCVPVMELSWDGQTWMECPFKYATSLPSSPPKFVSPHHHRVDQALIYDVFGGNGSTPVWTITGSFSPYYYQPYSGARAGIHRILEGYPYLGYIFDESALPKDRGPPLLGRISIHMLEPTTVAELRRTGNYWKRSYIGPHLAPFGKIDGFWERAIPVPELWHWDDVTWKRRSKLKRLMDRALAGEEPRAAVIADAPELTLAQVDAFWNDFLPLVQRGDPEGCSWTKLPQMIAEVRAKYDAEQLYAFERLAGRLTTMIVAKLEPFFFEERGKPPLKLKTYYHLSLLAAQILFEGEAAFAAIYQRPELAAEYASKLAIAKGCYLMAVFQYEALIFQAQKRRLTTRFLFPERPGGMTKYDRDAIVMLEQLSGAMELMVFLEEQFLGPEFERGFPEHYPSFVHQPDGEVAVVHYRAPPPPSDHG
ncbi:MAG TPA: lipase maturation factor family protein [Polyangiaceae bacterium]|nr:lipase maturation factor family protein [Polyangiaceae bacterium]